MFAVKMPREDFYKAEEDVRAEVLLNHVFRGGEGVMISTTVKR